jgi:uncharacterized RDD family membrane protein YckC
LPSAGLARRLASLVYEALLLAAVLIVASFPLAPLLQALPQPWSRLVNQGFLLGLIGLYLVWFWRHGGQTLAMRTWRIRLVSRAGGPVGLGQAWLRYGLAILGLAGLGIGFLWALWDRDRQFLHDRLAGTRLVRLPAFDPPKGDGRAQAEDDQGG